MTSANDRINVHDTIGHRAARVRILYINPNSTLQFTKETVDYLSPQITSLSDVRIDFYTAPLSAPRSIDGTLDGVVSTYTILQDLNILSANKSNRQAISDNYDVVVVGCFSAHPLVPALKEILKPTTHIIGILEAGISEALNHGQSFGIATTGLQWEPLFDEAVRALGITQDRYTGTKGTGFNAVSLHGEGPATALLEASVDLVGKGAKVIVLGCAGMAPMRSSIEQRITERTGQNIPAIDGVQAAIDTGIARARKASTA